MHRCFVAEEFDASSGSLPMVLTHTMVFPIAPIHHQLLHPANPSLFLLLCRPELELRFDRPFAFAVVHAPTGLALFAGEVHRPKEWKGA
jgi:hypothetical protein